MLEFKVRPVSRFVVTRYEADAKLSYSSVVGEFDSHRKALDVAHAVAEYEGGEYVHVNNLDDIPALLRHIAEETSKMIPVKRGLVFIELETGTVVAYGLGKEIGDIGELIDKGVEHINADTSLVV